MDTAQWISKLLFFLTAIVLYGAFLSYKKRHLPIARTMFLLMLGTAFYALGYGLEVISRSLFEMKIALQIEYLGIPFIATLWLFLVIQFTGTADRYQKRLALILFSIPITIFILHLTNHWHHLVYEGYILNEEGSFPLYITDKGPWYQVHVFYKYFVFLFGTFLFFPMYWKSTPFVRKQIIVLVIGAAVPAMFNMSLWFGMNVNLTPFGLALSGVIYIWGILQFNLLRFTPLALTQVFETTQDGIVLLDYENQIVSYNIAAEGVLPELGLTKQYPAFVGEVLSTNSLLIERINTAHIGGERFLFHKSHTNGTKQYYCSISFIYDSGKIPIGKMLMFNDITELKENEERLLENARQLSELNSFKDKMFTVVAHDIRDPLARLVSISELLGEELVATGAEHTELFQTLQMQVLSTFNIVENLLDWYRSQQGRVVFRPLGWNLQQVVRYSLALAEAKASMKQIQMMERINEQITVQADKEMLDLILRNLLSNAIKFTGSGGVIEITAVSEGELILVSIRDNGAGIDEMTAEMLRLDEPFFIESITDDDRGKARFGLVLAKEFVRIQGGSLWFESVPGVGTTFFFSVPSKAGHEVAFDDEVEEKT